MSSISEGGWDSSPSPAFIKSEEKEGCLTSSLSMGDTFVLFVKEIVKTNVYGILTNQ